jgi:hypothetical protein
MRRYCAAAARWAPAAARPPVAQIRGRLRETTLTDTVNMILVLGAYFLPNKPDPKP